MTEEMPIRNPRYYDGPLDGEPTDDQVRTALYVLEYIRDETTMDPTYMYEASRVVSLWNDQREVYES